MVSKEQIRKHETAKYFKRYTVKRFVISTALAISLICAIQLLIGVVGEYLVNLSVLIMGVWVVYTLYLMVKQKEEVKKIMKSYEVE